MTIHRPIKPIDLSIIYVNYKTSRLILDSIKSVKDKTHDVSYEIIVVDNNSEDENLPVLLETYPEVIFIQSDENIGFGRANNLGAQIAKGDYLFFLNPDTLLANNAIDILYKYISTHEEVGVCGGNLFDLNRKPTFSHSFIYPPILQEFFSIFYIHLTNPRYIKSRYFNYTQKVIDVDTIIGADFMVRKDVFHDVEGFDPRFFMNSEETELCVRIKKHGYKIKSVPMAEIVHLEGQSSYIKKSRLAFLYEGMYIYQSILYGFNSTKYLYAIIQFKNSLRIIMFTVFASKNKIVYWKMKRDTNKQVYLSFNKRGNNFYTTNRP